MSSHNVKIWQCKELEQTMDSFESSRCHQVCTRDSGGARRCMKNVLFGQDDKGSRTVSGWDPSRREVEEVVHRRDGTFQNRVTISAYFLHCGCRAVNITFVFVDLLKTKSEAQASLSKIVFSLGTPKKLRQDNAKECLSEHFKMYCFDAGILQKRIIPEVPPAEWRMAYLRVATGHWR